MALAPGQSLRARSAARWLSCLLSCACSADSPSSPQPSGGANAPSTPTAGASGFSGAQAGAPSSTGVAGTSGAGGGGTGGLSNAGASGVGSSGTGGVVGTSDAGTGGAGGSPLVGPWPPSATFSNPVHWQDLADLEVIRVDDAFYYTASTMHYSPGAPILRSYDLVNWEFAVPR